MQLFYGTSLENGIITLTEAESLHCTKVLRMKAGEEIHVTDGNGHFYHGVIEVAHDKRTQVRIKETSTVPLPGRPFHLYVALTKHADRLEWMLEKCIELGLTSFTPLITQRTERKNIRTDRLELIALSAMKQSLKAWATQIHPAMSFKQAIAQDSAEIRMIAYCDDTGARKSFTEVSLGASNSVFIGPEGDFTPEEVSLALEKGYTGIHLGPSRLRTETAGLAACNWMYWSSLG